MSAPLLSISQLEFAYDGGTVIASLDLDVMENEVLVIVGPSGCGKSTLLRLIAGLEHSGKGSITIDGVALNSNGIHLPPEKRPVGMVFQGLALFPHMTVADNIGFGLHKIRKVERAQLVQQELASVGLAGLGDRYPHQLSGGQQQRVAIARSLVMRPKLLLMDEPFSDLDAHTRGQVRTEVLRILRAHGVTAIIVSHDREDATHLGDRIALMNNGSISIIGSAEEVRTKWEEHQHPK